MMIERETICDVVVNSRLLSWFDYRGVRVEVGHPHEHYGWTYYLYLALDRFEDQGLAKKLWLQPSEPNEFGSQYYPTSKAPLLHDLDWHGGLTWYSKELFMGDKRGIKVGCDYSHLWDEDMKYDLDWIVADAKHTVDVLHELCAYRTEK